MTFSGLDYSRHPQVAGELFRTVQRRGLFDDDKTFVDAAVATSPDEIREQYLARRDDPEFDLAAFVDEQFHVPEPVAPESAVDADDMDEYVEQLWSTLTRSFDPASEETLIPVPEPHVVPGGRFREMYYWDSYFTAEGLAAAGRVDTVTNLATNYASLVDRFGFVPLGNRVYYDSRSQLPLYYRLLTVLERERGFEAIEAYVDRVAEEHDFWMAGAEDLDAGDAHRRAVRLPDGALANRFWDDRASPRPESYTHDRKLAENLPPEDRPDLFRDIRAACESGWDFSTRWLADPEDATSIRTTEHVPVDLNAVLYGMESSLAEWYDRLGDDRADRYREAAAARKETIEQYCWDDEANFYVDYIRSDGSTAEDCTLAGVVPLFTGVAAADRAAAVADRLREEFLVDGGLVTTLRDSGEQWDYPHGWAPLHWMAVVGLRNYGHDDLAKEISDRWLALNRASFEQTGTMAEKYDVVANGLAGDAGEYELQFGFGWTNGVALALEDLFEDAPRPVEQ